MEREITATPFPIEIHQPNEILQTGINEAIWCGEIALDYLGGKTFQGSDDNIKLSILSYWLRKDEAKCTQIWVDQYARNQYFNELVKLLKYFKHITYVKWEVDNPKDYHFSQTNNPYILQQLDTKLTILGDYQCPPPTSTSQLTNTFQIISTPQIVDTNTDDPFTYTIRKMTVEVQQVLNRVVMRTWIPEDDILQLLRENCH